MHFLPWTFGEYQVFLRAQGKKKSGKARATPRVWEELTRWG